MSKKIPKILPRGTHVLIKPDSEESRVSEYGIITPSNVEQEQKSTGIVIAIGDCADDIKKGDRVVYGTFAGDDIEMDGEKYKLIEEEFILAFLK